MSETNEQETPIGDIGVARWSGGASVVEAHNLRHVRHDIVVKFKKAVEGIASEITVVDPFIFHILRSGKHSSARECIRAYYHTKKTREFLDLWWNQLSSGLQ